MYNRGGLNQKNSLKPEDFDTLRVFVFHFLLLLKLSNTSKIHNSFSLFSLGSFSSPLFGQPIELEGFKMGRWMDGWMDRWMDKRMDI